MNNYEVPERMVPGRSLKVIMEYDIIPGPLVPRIDILTPLLRPYLLLLQGLGFWGLGAATPRE